MVYDVEFFVLNFIFDLLLTILCKKFFKLNVSVFEIIFMQFFGVASVCFYCFCGLLFWQFFVLKLVAHLLVCLLITDSLKPKRIFQIFAFEMFLLFSIFGFFKFILMVCESAGLLYFEQKIAKSVKFLIIIAVLFYFVAIFAFFTKMSKYKEIKKLLLKVSFELYGKHIKINGLMDSGNSLIDTKTGYPVVVVSAKTLKKYFDDFDYKMILSNGFCSRSVLCEVAGGFSFKMPIVDVGQITLDVGGESKKFKCVIGVVNQKFCGRKSYECLLHKEFV